MATQTYLTDVRQDLSYLLGEDSLPSPWPARRDTFIQRALEQIYRVYDFEMNKVATTLTLTGGVGILPTNARPTPDLTDVRYIRSGQGNDDIFHSIPYDQQDAYSQGDFRYWLVPNQDGTITFNTTESTYSALSIQYELASPVITASLATPFPSSMVIAEGALVFERRAQDKDADISQEDAIFRTHLEDVISAENRNQPLQRAIGIEEAVGRYPGEPQGGEKDYPFTRLNF